MVDSRRSLHLVLLLGLACIVQTLAQVCPYSDPRCSCIDTNIICTGLQEIPPLNPGIRVGEFLHLTFERGNISSIPNNSLPPGLTAISLLENPFTNINVDAFNTSAPTLFTLTIRGAAFNSLPAAVKKLTKLVFLDISDTSIQIWDAATVKQIAASLASLRLTNVGLSAWPSWISDFHLLITVDLSWNSLKSIPDDAFSSLKDKITSLILSHADLTHVPQALSTLSRVSILDLSYNTFTNLSEFDRITEAPFAQKEFHLYLDSVGLTRIPNFSKVTGLRSIRLTFNAIQDVPAGSLPSSLTSLDLSNNILSSVPRDVASMSNLAILYLSNNLITVIEPNTIPTRLIMLDLSFNSLTSITNTTFKNLKILIALYLNENPISTISNSAFSDLVLLQSILISSSRLTEIPLAFTQLRPPVYLLFTSTRPLSCPCPTPQQLVQWYTSHTGPLLILDSCSNGESVDYYLRGQCRQQMLPS
ncbi:hypothetical protein BsWGS_16457 [Bradybaena similaris]